MRESLYENYPAPEIAELLEDLCPDGVELKAIGDVSTGYQISSGLR